MPISWPSAARSAHEVGVAGHLGADHEERAVHAGAGAARRGSAGSSAGPGRRRRSARWSSAAGWNERAPPLVVSMIGPPRGSSSGTAPVAARACARGPARTRRSRTPRPAGRWRTSGPARSRRPSGRCRSTGRPRDGSRLDSDRDRRGRADRLDATRQRCKRTPVSARCSHAATPVAPAEAGCAGSRPRRRRRHCPCPFRWCSCWCCRRADGADRTAAAPAAVLVPPVPVPPLLVPPPVPPLPCLARAGASAGAGACRRCLRRWCRRCRASAARASAARASAARATAGAAAGVAGAGPARHAVLSGVPPPPVPVPPVPVPVPPVPPVPAPVPDPPVSPPPPPVPPVPGAGSAPGGVDPPPDGRRRRPVASVAPWSSTPGSGWSVGWRRGPARVADMPGAGVAAGWPETAAGRPGRGGRRAGVASFGWRRSPRREPLPCWPDAAGARRRAGGLRCRVGRRPIDQVGEREQCLRIDRTAGQAHGHHSGIGEAQSADAVERELDSTPTAAGRVHEYGRVGSSVE